MAPHMIERGKTVIISGLTRDLRLLLEISTAMVAEKDLGRLLDLIVRDTSTVMDAERCTLYLYDEDRRELVSRIALGMEVKEIRLPADHGIAGHVAMSRDLVNIPDAYADSRFDRQWDEKSGFQTRNVLCGPLVTHEGRVVGVLQVLNKRNGAFTESDIALFTAFSAHAAVAIENASLYEEREKLLQSLIRSLAAAVDARDPVTAGHSDRVGKYATLVAEEMGLAAGERRVLDIAASLHDVGKIGVRDAVLLKAGQFTPEERQEVQGHVARTRDILNQVYFPRDLRGVVDVAGAHHERMDGSGYPLKIAGDRMPVPARILAVVDVFDALTAYDRPYKKAWTSEKAFGILENTREFDPVVVAALKQVVARRGILVAPAPAPAVPAAT
ncbi:MAG: HD domain-containing phosphohydrolase [Planctomycetota bacterium]